MQIMPSIIERGMHGPYFIQISKAFNSKTDLVQVASIYAGVLQHSVDEFRPTVSLGLPYHDHMIVFRCGAYSVTVL